MATVCVVKSSGMAKNLIANPAIIPKAQDWVAGQGTVSISLILIRATCGDRHAVLNAIKTVSIGHDGTQRAGPTIVDGYPYQRD